MKIPFKKITLPVGAILLAVACCMLAGCASPVRNPPATAGSVDITRYLGRWYEIARLPMPFQKASEAAMAEYGLNTNGTLSVHNIAVRPDGSEHGIRGYATPLNPPENTKLAVRFNTWFALFIPVPKEGNYWILYKDAAYSRAIVGTPDRKYLWILARSPKIPDAELQDLEARAGKLGFDLSGLIHDPRH
jgi:apolipoprotein D and lipocalin family protein